MNIRFVYHKSKAMSDAEELMSLNVIKTDISSGCDHYIRSTDRSIF
jgi:hypothetical protein